MSYPADHGIKTRPRIRIEKPEELREIQVDDDELRAKDFNYFLKGILVLSYLFSFACLYLVLSQ